MSLNNLPEIGEPTDVNAEDERVAELRDNGTA